jgi:hypothetical protein
MRDPNHPLVKAMGTRGAAPVQTDQSPAEDYGGDLHTRKDSHVSIPMQGMEYHFSAGDLNMPVEVNGTYVLRIPVICSSQDTHDIRFKQVAKTYVDKGPVFKESQNTQTQNEAPPDKPPLVRTQVSQYPG